MENFLSLMASGVFGGLAVKYTEFFFKNSNQRLDKLEEAYMLASKIVSFCNQSSFFVTLFIYCETNSLSKDSLLQLKITETPLPQLNFLLNFHLDAPQKIIIQLQEMEELLMNATKPMAAPLIKQSTSDEMHAEAIKLCIQARYLSTNVQNELQKWLISERDKTRQKIDFITLMKSWVERSKTWWNAKLSSSNKDNI